MSSKKHKRQKLSKEKKRALEALFDVKYVDGKPVKVKVDPLAELKKELQPDEDENPVDVEKRTLYANLPQAQLKKDRSITARDLNMTVESYNQKRDEILYGIKYSTITGFENRWTKYLFSKPKGWEFMWDKVNGVLKTIKKPDDGYNLEYKNKILIQSIADDPKVTKLVEDKIKEHIKLKK